MLAQKPTADVRLRNESLSLRHDTAEKSEVFTVAWDHCPEQMDFQNMYWRPEQWSIPILTFVGCVRSWNYKEECLRFCSPAPLLLATIATFPLAFLAINHSCPLAFLALQKGEGCRRRGEGSSSVHHRVINPTYQLNASRANFELRLKFRLKLKFRSNRKRILR
jgi:hypothetical protein